MSNAPDILPLAQAMADAIEAQRATRGLIGKDRRMRMTPEFLQAEIALDHAEAAFREATGQMVRRG